jgi:hypothetical protein
MLHSIDGENQFSLTLLWVRSTCLLLHKSFTLHRH